MARINGTEQPIKKATPLGSSGGFNAKGGCNYIQDNFTKPTHAFGWPMVEDEQSCIDSIEKLITKKRLKIKQHDKGNITTTIGIKTTAKR